MSTSARRRLMRDFKVSHAAATQQQPARGKPARSSYPTRLHDHTTIWKREHDVVSSPMPHLTDSKNLLEHF